MLISKAPVGPARSRVYSEVAASIGTPAYEKVTRISTVAIFPRPLQIDARMRNLRHQKLRQK